MKITNKTKTLLIAGLAGGAILLIGGIYAYQTVGYNLSEQQAQEIAYVNAGVSSSEVTYYQIEKDREGTIPTYDVEFRTENVEFSYTIHASSGSIMDREREDNGFVSGTVTNQKNKTATTTVQQTAHTPKLSKEQARTIALKDAGLTEENVANLLVSVDEEQGHIYYDIDFKDPAKQLDYDYQIDGESGAIIEKSSESSTSDQ